MLRHDPEYQDIELTREIGFPGDVTFDPEQVTLQGTYGDQLSLYRARRAWKETFESCFLLDPGHDFEIRVSSSVAEGRFTLVCSFLTACGRYAFWRLTSEQAPEAQYLIETAHLPQGESVQSDFLSAPDLRPAVETGLGSERLSGCEAQLSFIERLRSVVRDFLSSRRK